MFSIFTEISQYMPHGMCLLWEPWLLILWAGSDVLIFLSYFAIPFIIFRVLLKRDDIKQRGLVILFASFILLCGITHAVSVVTLWLPIYPLQGVIKLATGLVSAATAIMLFRLGPTLVAIPSFNSLEDANRKLKAEVASHEQTLSALRQARDDLERKVAERTAELNEVNAKLSITAREAIHRSHNLIAVVTSMARQSSRTQTNVATFTEILIGRLSALANATGAIMKHHQQSAADLGDVVNTQLDPLVQTYPGKVQVEAPELKIDAEAAQQISLAIHELATNAQKHGALGTSDAAIAVRFSITSEPTDPDQDRLVLEWREDLGAAANPSIADQERKGFGTRLLTQIIPTMLGGHASRTLEDSQLIYRLDVPFAAILPDQIRTGNEAFASHVLDGNFAET